MTREELKAHCKREIAKYDFWSLNGDEKFNNSKLYQEHKLVLELLEQEPCEDAVSRQAVLEITAETGALETQARVKALPSVTPKQRWIPVSERLPEEGEDVLIWYEYFRRGEYNCMYQTYGIGYQCDGHWGGSVCGKNARCIAWMPLPEPYKEGESE